jgi:hypothetical protein
LKDQQAAGNADDQAEDIQGRVSFSFDQVANGELPMIFKHFFSV